jgi:hypothetical protein
MSFNTLAKRMSVLYDTGMVPYPDSSIDKIDRAFLCNLFNIYDLKKEEWQKSYLGKIYYNLILILDEIPNSTINQEDFNKTTFPLFNIYMDIEVNQLDFNTPNMDAFSNKVTFRIDCFNKINHESSNALFDADVVLDDLLKLFIDKINDNDDINGLTMGEYYITSRRIKSGIGNDIFIPKKLEIKITVPYNQSMLEPLTKAF